MMMSRSIGAAVAAGTAALALAAGPAQAATQVQISTPLGDIVVDLDPTAAPNTVNNFLNYINDGDYVDSFIHRTARDADSGVNVIQGGGFTIDTGNNFNPVATDPSVANEFNQSNLRGTIAMARQGGLPDSATSQWFINVTDNVVLDGIDGGFTVFGNVSAGMDVVDAIFALTDVNISGTPYPFSDVPLLATAAPPTVEQDEVVSTTLSIIPEPSSAALLALGGLAMMRRRR